MRFIMINSISKVVNNIMRYLYNCDRIKRVEYKEYVEHE